MDDGKTEDEPNPPENLSDLDESSQTTNFSTSFTQPGSRGKRKLIALAVVILLMLGVGVYFLRTKTSQPQASPSPSPQTLTPLVEQTSTPSPTVESVKYTLRVLNGTKTAGLAASTSAKLKDLGYKIDKVGNATNSAFPKTVVRVKENLKDLLVRLIQDLSDQFDAQEGPILETADTVDAEVILGTK